MTRATDLRRGSFPLALTVLGWVAVAVAAVYGGATALASIKRVPQDRIGIVLLRGSRMRALGEGIHLVQPFGTKVVLIPRGPERIVGDVRDAVTRDGWRLSAWVQLYAHVFDDREAALACEDWRREALDTSLAAVKLLLERSDAQDLRASPQALDEGAREEANELLKRFGTTVEWLRVTVKWAQATAPLVPPPSKALRYEVDA
jgi:regulator of protease activity HflC (stomatin/prohibitin superfamily)